MKINKLFCFACALTMLCGCSNEPTLHKTKFQRYGQQVTAEIFSMRLNAKKDETQYYFWDENRNLQISNNYEMRYLYSGKTTYMDKNNQMQTYFEESSQAIKIDNNNLRSMTRYNTKIYSTNKNDFSYGVNATQSNNLNAYQSSEEYYCELVSQNLYIVDVRAQNYSVTKIDKTTYFDSYVLYGTSNYISNLLDYLLHSDFYLPYYSDVENQFYINKNIFTHSYTVRYENGDFRKYTYQMIYTEKELIFVSEANEKNETTTKKYYQDCYIKKSKTAVNKINYDSYNNTNQRWL